MLVENSIKHNVISKKRPLLIEIYNDCSNNLIIRNNLQLKSQTQVSTGTGLLSIKNKFELTFGKTFLFLKTQNFLLFNFH